MKKLKFLIISLIVLPISSISLSDKVLWRFLISFLASSIISSMILSASTTVPGDDTNFTVNTENCSGASVNPAGTCDVSFDFLSGSLGVQGGLFHIQYDNGGVPWRKTPIFIKGTRN